MQETQLELGHQDKGDSISVFNVIYEHNDHALSYLVCFKRTLDDFYRFSLLYGPK